MGTVSASVASIPVASTNAQMDLSGLQLNQLLLVEALSVNKNLGEAAEKIGMSQSAASHALARLRQELGDPIFIRTSAGMEPTPYGTRLSGAVSKALELIRGGIAKVPAFSPASSTRRFKIIMSDVSQMLYLSKMLTRLREEAPSISLRIAPVPTKAPHLILESGDVDLAVGVFTQFIAGCRQKRVYRERYVCIARKNHPSFVDGMTTEAFRSVQHVVVDAKGLVHEQLDPIFVQYNVPRASKLDVPGFGAVPLVVASSDLVAIMSKGLAETYASILPLQIMAPPVALPSYEVKLFWHERFHRDPANLWLRNLFFNLFSD